MTYKILLSRDIPIPPLTVGGNPVEIEVYKPENSNHGNARVYCTTALDKVDSDLIDSLPKSVGLIANIGVGTDNIDLAAAHANNMLVSNTPVVTEDTADLAFALILASCRQLSANERFLRAKSWSTDRAHALLGSSVQGKTLGILGFGAIGQAVARRAQGFNLKVIYHGPNEKTMTGQLSEAKYEPNFQKFLSSIDILSLHCSLNEQTYHMINQDSLRAMKPGVIIINTGRGSLIDENALVDALSDGHVGGAGLDVFEDEPNIHPGLLKNNTITLTPHIGSATQECRMQMGARAIGNILHFLEHGKPVDLVD